MSVQRGESAVSGQTVLVTGGAGFIGSHLVDTLAGDNDVRVLDNFVSGSRDVVPDCVECIDGDVRDDDALAAAMSGVDLVFHLAALIDVEAATARPRTCHAVNATGTLALLDLARREDARVVYASSAAVYGPPERLPVSESDRKTPQSPYGISKLAGDHYVRRFHDRYGLATVALRYFNVYGPRQTESGVVSIFVERATSGRPLTVAGDGTQTRDFVHVDDVVRANVLAAETDTVGEAFNVGTGRSVSIGDLASHVQAVSDTDVRVAHSDPREGDIARSRADITKAREQLGYEPTVELSDGLTELVESTD